MAFTLRRRQVLLGSLASFAVPSRVAWAANPPVRTGPRYVVSLLLSGGIDAVFTTDPKTRSEVERWVDVPFASKDIFEASGLRLGPHLKPLESHTRRMAVLNGVLTFSANHQSGIEQFRCLRASVTPRTPGALDLIGAVRDGQPVGHMTEQWLRAGFVPRLGSDRRPKKESLARTIAAMRGHAAKLRRIGTSPQALRTAQSYEEAAALIERAPSQSFTEAPESPQAEIVQDLDAVVWALKNDLTRAFSLNIGGHEQPWDTHTFNLERQSELSGFFFPVLAKFLKDLETTSNEHGTLADNTLVVIGSDVGRFPRLNDMKGKDHLPEVPLMFYGAGVTRPQGRGAFGQTGRRMEAIPISLKTGRPDSQGKRVTLDDVGRTVLELCGVRSPSLFGYAGDRLDFLVAR
jgi:uncharacterized protein (DUF1501 family)